MAIIWGIFIPYHFPIIANIDNFLNEHGGVRGEARFPPNNVAIIRGIYYTIQFPNHSQYWQIADLDAPQLPL